MKIRTVQPGQETERIGQPEYNSKDSTGGSGQPGQNRIEYNRNVLSPILAQNEHYCNRLNKEEELD
jgi:hypothetical protein